MNFKIFKKKFFVMLLVLAILFPTIFGCGQKTAETKYPSKPITLVVTHNVGGGIDTATRGIQMILQKHLGTPVVVENRPGAGGLTALNYIAQQKNDGYTILCGSIPSLLLKKYLTDEKTAEFKDLIPISAWVNGDADPLLVKADGQFKTFADFVKVAKEKVVSVGIGGGMGSSDHLVYTLLKEKVGLKLNPVPFDSSGEAIAAVLGEHVDCAIGSISSSTQVIKDGKARAIALTSSERAATLPDVPTFKELGYPEIMVEFHVGAFGPPGLDKEKVAVLNTAFEKAFNDPEFRQWAEKASIPIGEFYGTDKWTQFIKDTDEIMKSAAPLLKANRLTK